MLKNEKRPIIANFDNEKNNKKVDFLLLKIDMTGYKHKSEENASTF